MNEFRMSEYYDITPIQNAAIISSLKRFNHSIMLSSNHFI